MDANTDGNDMRAAALEALREGNSDRAIVYALLAIDSRLDMLRWLSEHRVDADEAYHREIIEQLGG